jgi:quinol monooxygenase YgiN
MYGTIMRGRIKAGRRAEMERLAADIAPSHQEHGLVSFQLAWEEADPDRFVAIIHFRDRESYRANAERPETDRDFRRQMELIDGEPEWIDVEYGPAVTRSAATA